MSVTLSVLLVAGVAALVVWAMSRRPGGPEPIDPEAEERWLIRWLGSHPRFGRHASAIDERVAGGLMLVVALSIVFIAAVVVGLLFDMVDRDSGLARWDRAVAQWGSEHATERSTDVLSAITHLGGTVYLVVIAVVVATVDFVRSRNRHVALFLLTVLVGVVLINNTLKWIVARPRPDLNQLVETSGSSFPSGHSSAAAAGWCAFALVLSRPWPRRGRAMAAGGAAIVAAAVGASRALLGVHWLTDVLAGLMVGWGWFLLASLAFGGRLQQLGEPAERAPVAGSSREATTVEPVTTGRSRPPA